MAILAAVVDVMTQSGTTPRSNEPTAESGRLGVVYVHSSPTERARVQRLLESGGFAVATAATPHEAVERADVVSPALVVVDAVPDVPRGVDGFVDSCHSLTPCQASTPRLPHLRLRRTTRPTGVCESPVRASEATELTSG